MSLSHRRRRAPAMPSDAGPPPCPTLAKAATFQASSHSSSPLNPAPVAHLSRSQSHVEDVVHANRQRITSDLVQIDQALASSGNRGYRIHSLLHDSSLPIPRGLAAIIPHGIDNQCLDKEQLKVQPYTAHRQRRHDSDSGLGSSIHSQDKCAQTEEQLFKLKIKNPRPSPATADVKMDKRPSPLKNKTKRRIFQSIIYPLLDVPDFESFHPLVLEIPQRIQQKLIVCLRDVEKHLLVVAPDKTKDAAQYLNFCIASIHCVQATIDQTSEDQQVLAGDRPYSNGYFIDLTDQIKEYARQLVNSVSSHHQADSDDLDRASGIQLLGGLAETGRPAQLVRLNKDGTAISLADGKPVDISQGPVQFKRSLSAQLDEAEEIKRSMARPRKNAKPEHIVPKRCLVPGCNKTFERRCDLTKHDRTHSRPYKCGDESCKYHEIGWANEKERDRHMNDKHSKNPTTYPCHYPNCAYKSKRKSNCKQHMEKNHGWEYHRTKNNGRKKSESASGSSPSSNHSASPNSTADAGRFSQSNAETPQSSSQATLARPSRQLSLSSSADTTPTLRSMSTPRSPTMSTPSLGQGDMSAGNTALGDGTSYVPVFGPQPGSLDADEEMFTTGSSDFNEQYPAWHNSPGFIMPHDDNIYTAQMLMPDMMHVMAQESKLAQHLSLQSMAPPACDSISTLGQPQYPWPETPEIMSDLMHGTFDTSFVLGVDATSQLCPSTLTKDNNLPSLTEPSGHFFSQSMEPDIFQQANWTSDFQSLG